MSRVTAEQIREAANTSGITLTGADVYALADNLTAILIRDADKAIERIKAEAERKGRIEEAKRQPHEDTYEGSCGVHMPRFCSTCRRVAALEGKETEHD